MRWVLIALSGWAGGLALLSSWCPDRCSAIVGKQLVEPTGCVMEALIGCADCSVAYCSGAPEGTCLVSELDGRVVLTVDTTKFTTGWSSCTEEQRTRIRTAPAC